MISHLRFLLALFTILSCTTIASWAVQGTHGGVVFEKTCVFEGETHFWADFNAAKTLPNVTEKGLARIESHLGNLGALDDGANQAMLSRLRSGQTTTPDINFYMHELKESARMRAGLDYDAAHKATLQWQGIPYGPASPAQIYHPDVIRQFSTEFNPAAWPQ